MSAAKEPLRRTYEAEFLRFPKGHLYTISFDEEGVITKATIYIEEMDRELDVTPHVKAEAYWQKRVELWLNDHQRTAIERKYFKAHKDHDER